MEPNEFDDILKGKLQEESDRHQSEMDAAKPFVWSAIQQNIGNQHSLKWYHLAAAILLLLISFAFIFQNAQKSHEKEMLLLSDKVDKLEQQFVTQNSNLNAKDYQVNQLTEELKAVEMKLTELQQYEPVAVGERIVYRTDTVVVKQIEYLTRASNPVIAKETSIDIQETNTDNVQANNKRSADINYNIYPSVASQPKNQKSETIRVKFLKASRN